MNSPLPPELLRELESVAASGHDHMIRAGTLMALLEAYREVHQVQSSTGDAFLIPEETLRKEAVEILQRERDTLRTQLAEAQGCCAAYREVLEELAAIDTGEADCLAKTAGELLAANDCGKHFVPRAELEAAKKMAHKFSEHVDKVEAENTAFERSLELWRSFGKRPPEVRTAIRLHKRFIQCLILLLPKSKRYAFPPAACLPKPKRGAK